MKFKPEILDSELDIEFSDEIEIINVEENELSLIDKDKQYTLQKTALQIGVNEIFLYGHIILKDKVGQIKIKLQM